MGIYLGRNKNVAKDNCLNKENNIQLMAVCLKTSGATIGCRFVVGKFIVENEVKTPYKKKHKKPNEALNQQQQTNKFSTINGGFSKRKLTFFYQP